ncbi:hypothetical protein QQS21_006901 [Conoideocrella luteorostrata]|uniref:Ketosynthase family 3 (KS3) domain-containing protein n=1 Tax=Conoideocrella luteorostrata TaxID=1105319 RepID=A0AAJ0FZV8_9HYPO|nr:hypothetical protein QQS21_006901 [Conoideocrella luteorostrata]
MATGPVSSTKLHDLQQDWLSFKSTRDSSQSSDIGQSHRIINMDSSEPQQKLTGIVGDACRVAGASSPSELWGLIESQKDVGRNVPANRFNMDGFYQSTSQRQGSTNVKRDYFLDQDPGLFDAWFFCTSKKEAESMGPQQRLLLEVVYEGLEDAGITLDDIAGSKTSVFTGSFSLDYQRLIDLEQPASTSKYAVTGLSQTIVAGSALHLHPGIFVEMQQLGMLAADGRSKAYDVATDGYARGEGIVAIILKRVVDAEAHHDIVKSVIRAVGVNHDGSTQGITMPNEAAQESLMRETYRNVNISLDDTAYFEGHGTGKFSCFGSSH